MRVRLLTYNIHKCIGGVDRRYDLARTCDAIGGYEPDVVLLQEVARGARFGGEVQIDRIAERLGLRHVVHYVNVRRKRVEYGNAILSRFPLGRPENIDVRVAPFMARSVLHARARVRLDGRHTRTLHLFNLHIGLLESERRKQLRQFLDSHPLAGLDHRTPIVVAGDFNDVWGSVGSHLQPQGFTGTGQRIRTFPAFAPVRSLDAIFVRGDIRFESAFAGRSHPARRASDHLPLIADVEITSGRRRGGSRRS